LVAESSRSAHEGDMAKFALDELRVYAMAEQLADLVWELVRTWEPFSKSTVGHQLVRAADSVGANIAEGYGRASPADHQRFIRTARGSLYEVRHFLRRADKRKLLLKEQRAPLQALLKEMLPALNAYLRSLGHGS
jgi:four helix bundle protein